MRVPTKINVNVSVLTLKYRRVALPNNPNLSPIDKNSRDVVQYMCDAWGNCKVLKNLNEIASLNPYRYRGYYWDSEFGLYYLNARYYDPEVGRFISQDDISYLDPETLNGLNLFAYCLNNPVMGSDPDGTWSWKRFWKGFAIVAVAVAVVAITIATAGSGSVIGAMIIGGTVAAAGDLFSQAVIEDKSFSEVNWGQVAINGVAGAISSIPGVNAFAGAGIDAFASLVTEAFNSGSMTEALKAAFFGAVSSLIGSGASAITKKIGSRVVKKSMAKMSKTKLKNLIKPFVDAADINKSKNLNYLFNINPKLPQKIFGELIPTTVGSGISTSFSVALSALN